MQMGSPASKAHLSNDNFLIACEEFKFESIQELVDNMHEILYSKDVVNKTVTLLSYNVVRDKLQSHRVELQRKWGGKGIMGCEFLEGHLNRLPNNLEEIRREYGAKMAQREEIVRVQKELMSSDGVSRRLAENLKRKILRK